MPWEKSPKEKPCHTLPTVKKLLEQKRKRETSSTPPTCSTTAPSPAPPTGIPPLNTPEAPNSTGGASRSFSDMAASYEQWAPVPDSACLNSFYSPTSVSYPVVCSPPMITSFSPQPQQILGFGDTMMQTFECPDNVLGPSLSSTWPAFPNRTPQVGFGTQMDVGKLEEARSLLRGMDYSRTISQDEDGDTILHIYTAKGLREYAFAAAERLRDLDRLDAKEHKGKTALLVAVTANQPDIVQDLLAFQTDVNACDVKGQTALHLAASYGFPAVLQVVLTHGSGVNLEARNFEGMTPLHCAVVSHCASMKTTSPSSLRDVSLQNKAEERLACLQMLLNAGASVLSQEIKSNKTALHLAVKEGNTELVRYLVKIPVPNMKDFVNMKAHGHTALHMAAGLHGDPHQDEIIRLLLSRGADPSIRNLENDQAAHLLQSGPGGEQLKLLLKRRSASTRRRIACSHEQE